MATSVDALGTVTTKQDTFPAAQKGAGGFEESDRYRRMFDASRTYSNTTRLKAQRDRDYYDGKQLSPEILAVLRKRKQPEIYTNRIRPALNGILGALISAKSDPRAFPRTPQDDNAADTATKVLRYIADTTHLDQTKIDAAEDYLIEGTAAVIVEAQGEDILLSQIRYEEFFYDPYSRRPDFKDAKYVGIAKWMYAEDVKALYPERYAAMGDPVQGYMTNGALDSVFNDRPDNVLPWVDRARKRLMVVEMYHREGGDWMRVVFCAAGIFEEGVSPYHDDRGHTVNPIEATSCYVDRENNRYGVVRDMVPIQDEVNARRSRSLHLANSRQVQQSDANATPVDADTARAEAARADGVIPAGWQIVPTAAMAQGNAELLIEAKSEIQRMSPVAAAHDLNQGSADSGRARLVVQQAGLTELARPLGRLEDWELRLYKQAFWRAKQFWKAPKFVRVTDDPKSPEFIGLNQPRQGMVLTPQPMTDGMGQPLLHGETGEPVMHMVPSIGVVGYDNAIAEMDMDIILDTVQDTANLEQEVWKELMEIAQTFPIGSPQFMLALEIAPLPDKLDTIERIKALTQQPPTPEQQEQQQQEEQVKQVAVGLQLSSAQADLQNKEASTQKSLAEAARTRAEVATMLTGATDQAEGSATNGIRF